MFVFLKAQTLRLKMNHPKSKFQFNIFINLIRALFPNWNFFDRVAFSFELWFKVQGSTRWEAITFDQIRQPFGLLLNPDVNLALAQINIIEHFAKDIQDLQAINSLIHSREVQSLSTFKMLRSLIKLKLKDFEVPTSEVQFKVVAINPNEKIDLYISDWINVESVT